MRSLRQYTISEMVKLEPFSDAYKQFRNDLLLNLYLGRKAEGQAEFLVDCRPLRGKNIAAVVAFEQPWALDWLLTMSRKHLTDCTVLAFDNSRAPKRAEIAEVCRRHGAHYLALPSNRTRHVNRSHGMAMTWIYRNIIQAIEPENFAYFDHDMIPMEPLSLNQRLGEQDCFGLLNESEWGWQLWAGYCMFRFDRVGHLPLNFLYDFSFGLDTGGRNWKYIYRQLDRTVQRFADSINRPLRPTTQDAPRTVQVVDDSWVHIGSISYNNNFESKQAFFATLAAACENGVSWQQIRQG
ncbi:hypothetical protein [Paludibacterium yongneupense]|uniref:hypothetical protein n=1 Tax=Paludibacterium yongneupense TaxID=400061 RepID=UPI00041E05AB|nr:hypothetical protein [Paludibacterium yongneupense]